MDDPAVRIDKEFRRLLSIFNGFYISGDVYVSYQGNSREEGTLLGVDCGLDNVCQFDIRLNRNGEEITVKQEEVIMMNERLDLNVFANSLNACIDQFKQYLHGRYAVIFHEVYGIWIECCIRIVEITRGEGVATYLVVDFPCSIHEPFLLVPSHQVRRIIRDCRECGSMIPSDYWQIHLDPAIHLGHKLTMNFVSISRHFLGEDLFVETGDYPAILTETCLPWVDANIRFRVQSRIDNVTREESLESLLITGRIYNGENYGLDDYSLDISRTFEKFEVDLKGQHGIVNNEDRHRHAYDWVLVEFLSIRLSEPGFAEYNVRYEPGNETEWVSAINVRKNFITCAQCTQMGRTWYMPENDNEYRTRHNHAIAG